MFGLQSITTNHLIVTNVTNCYNYLNRITVSHLQLVKDEQAQSLKRNYHFH